MCKLYDYILADCAWSFIQRLLPDSLISHCVDRSYSYSNYYWKDFILIKYKTKFTNFYPYRLHTFWI